MASSIRAGLGCVIVAWPYEDKRPILIPEEVQATMYVSSDSTARPRRDWKPCQIVDAGEESGFRKGQTLAVYADAECFVINRLDYPGVVPEGFEYWMLGVDAPIIVTDPEQIAEGYLDAVAGLVN